MAGSGLLGGRGSGLYGAVYSALEVSAGMEVGAGTMGGSSKRAAAPGSSLEKLEPVLPSRFFTKKCSLDLTCSNKIATVWQSSP